MILPVPDVEPVVGQLRRRYDPSASVGVPAHITLVYPFCPAPVPNKLVREVQDLFATIGHIMIEFSGVGRFQETLYLKPEPIAALVMMTELLAKRWPQWPPYGGIHGDVVPHLTVADHQNDELVLGRIAAIVEPALPITTSIDEAWIIEAGVDGLWQRRARIPFRERGVVARKTSADAEATER